MSLSPGKIKRISFMRTSKNNSIQLNIAFQMPCISRKLMCLRALPKIKCKMKMLKCKNLKNKSKINYPWVDPFTGFYREILSFSNQNYSRTLCEWYHQ